MAEGVAQQGAQAGSLIRRLPRLAPALVPALATVALMLVWAAHSGGYDTDTWYWGALLLLAVLTVTLIALGPRRAALSRAGIIALTAFSAYLGWSYLSLTWSEAPGWALEGSNRALLYGLAFALFLVLPWTAEAGLLTLLVFVLGVGAIALVVQVQLASGDRLGQLFDAGRLIAPTNYFNSTVALFMTSALLATALASRRQLPAPVRGTLIAVACASLQLCVLGQSRGWLFTFPLVILAAVAVVPDRLRFAAAAVLPLAATLLPLRRLLAVFGQGTPAGLRHAALTAGRTSLTLCAGALVLGSLIAWADARAGSRGLAGRARRRVGALVAAVALLGAGGAAAAATHGHPVAFVKRQWQGFTHPQPASAASSHFASVGTGRYDFWRVSLDAVAARPLGGLGQDNFADYYVVRRRTSEEPRWTHSLELRLLAHTGIVGFVLFTVFLVAALAPARRARRSPATAARSVAGAALLPLVVWLIHGSVDWFWEMPALTAPALAFLAMAGALAPPPRDQQVRRPAQRAAVPAGLRLAGGVAFLAAVAVLGFPYLSVREVALAGQDRQRDPAAALARLATAAALNPLSPEPGRIAGAIALETGRFAEAQRRFGQTIAREPGGWFAWLGDGLAASSLGDRPRAERDFRIAAAINPRQPVIVEALADVRSRHPLTAGQALAQLAGP
jgi:hypothetical protein